MRASAAGTENARFSNDFQGFRITVGFCVFLTRRGGPEMQELHELTLFSEGPGQEKHICVFFDICN